MNPGTSRERAAVSAVDRAGGRGADEAVCRTVGTWLVRLEVARRMLRIYPAGHPAVRQPLTQLLEATSGLESTRREVILIQVTPRGLLLEQGSLGEAARLTQRLAGLLHELGLVAFVVRPPLESAAVEAIVTLLASLRGRAGEEERQRVLAEAAEIPGLELIPLDVGWFVFSSSLGERPRGGVGLWQAMIRGLSGGALSGDDGGIASPAQLAQLVDEAGDVRGFLELLVEHLRRALGDAEERGSLLDGLALLGSLEEVVRAIRPENRPELARLLIRHGRPSGTLRARMPEILPPALLLDGVEALLAAGEALPEAVQRLVYLLAAPPGQERDPWRRRGVEVPEEVVARARGLLVRLSGAPGRPGGSRHSGASLDSADTTEVPFVEQDAVVAMREQGGNRRLIEALDEQRLEQQLELVLREACSLWPEEVVVTGLDDRLARRYVEHLDLGRLPEALSLFQELGQRRGRGRPISEAARQRLVGREGMDALLDAATRWGKQQRELLQIAQLVGVELMPPLLERLKVEESLSRRRRLMEMAIAVGAEALPFVRPLLDDPRWYVARNAMLLLRRLGDPGLVDRAVGMIVHPNLRLAAEALKTVVLGRDPRWLEGFQILLDRPDPRALHEVLLLAARLRHPELGRLLLAELDQRRGARLNEPETLELIEVLGGFELPEIGEILLKLAGLSPWRHTFRLTGMLSAVARAATSQPDGVAEQILTKVAAQRDPAAELASQLLAQRRRRSRTGEPGGRSGGGNARGGPAGSRDPDDPARSRA